MATITDRITDVLFELGNRSDINTGAPSQLAKWYRDAYISIVMGYPFEQLENTYRPTASGTDTVGFPSTARAVQSLVVLDSSGNYKAEPELKDIRYMRKTTNTTPGIPSVYAFRGSNMIFSPAFDTNDVYTIVLDTWDKPTITADIVSTTLNVPDDWLEAIDYAAMMRAHSRLGERDKARELRALLFGETTPTGSFIPGLLSQLATRAQKNAPARDYGVQPRGVKQGYTK